MKGTPAMQHLVNIHFTSATLAAALRGGAWDFGCRV
jgi:hypothetical protein